MRDSDTIENLAINAVNDAIIKCPLLSPHLSAGDKYPSVDGSIIVYKKEGKNKSDILNTVWVQVKGQECDSFDQDDITYAVEISDLTNYLNFGGTVFFVVEIDRNDNRKIFYETLLPVKIQELQDSISVGQKTKNISLKAFPTEKCEIETVIQNFCIDAHKQSSFATSKLLSLEDLKGNKYVESISFSTTKIGTSDDSLAPFFENEICFYVKFKGATTAEPIKIPKGKLMFQQTYTSPVLVGDKQYYDSFKAIRAKDGLSFIFGGCFKMSFNTELNSGKFTFQAPAFLSKRLRSLEFLNDLFETKILTIGGLQYNINDEDGSASAQYKQDLLMCNRAQTILDAMHIQDDLDMSKLTKNDAKSLEILEKSVLNHTPVEHISMENDTISCTDLHIANITIRLLISKSEEHEGLFDVEDFFNLHKMRIFYQKDGSDKGYILPPIASVSLEDIHKLCNVNYEGISDEFKTLAVDNPHLLIVANEVLNSLIKAYDIKANPRILNAAEDIALWLMTENIPDVTIAGKQMDIIQISKRRRKLKSTEVSDLQSIIDSPETSDFDKVGAYFLIGDKKRAKSLFKCLTADQQNLFNTSTIHKYWK